MIRVTKPFFFFFLDTHIHGVKRSMGIQKRTSSPTLNKVEESAIMCSPFSFKGPGNPVRIHASIMNSTEYQEVLMEKSGSHCQELVTTSCFGWWPKTCVQLHTKWFHGHPSPLTETVLTPCEVSWSGEVTREGQRTVEELDRFCIEVACSVHSTERSVT